jgi:hypothetical protein
MSTFIPRNYSLKFIKQPLYPLFINPAHLLVCWAGGQTRTSHNCLEELITVEFNALSSYQLKVLCKLNLVECDVLKPFALHPCPKLPGDASRLGHIIPFSGRSLWPILPRFQSPSKHRQITSIRCGWLALENLYLFWLKSASIAGRYS